MLQIEWKSSLYHSNGRPRSRPKASTVHGWLVKWRATFSGNEHLRKEGIREMREAKAVREWKKKKLAARRAKAGASKPLFRLWPISVGKSKKRRQRTPKALPPVPQHPPVKRPTRDGSQRLPASPTPSPRPTREGSQRLPDSPTHTPRLTREGSQRLPDSPTHSSRPPREGRQPRLPASPTHSPRPTPVHSRRSSHSRQGTPQSSRKASHDSRRDAARAADKKRR
ncbi:hypothetical protein V8E55_001883 [Tylopilus felleus]